MSLKGLKLENIVNLMPRGVRNNNPGNIVYMPYNRWKGQEGHDKDGFCIFSNPFWGCRAMYTVVYRYINNDGIHSLRSLIDRYDKTKGKSHDNYINFVAGQLGLYEHSPQLVNDYIPILIKIMIKFETGIDLFTLEFINRVADLTEAELTSKKDK